MKVKFISRVWEFMDVQLFFYQKDETGLYLMDPISPILRKHEPGTQLVNPTLTMSYQEAIDFVESVIEEARYTGMGMSRSLSKEDVLESTKVKAIGAHLEDMRRLVFGYKPPDPLLAEKIIIKGE